jgi:hypothetical protein
MQRITAIRCAPDWEKKGETDKGHSDFVAACQRHYRRFCQPARWFVYPMRSEESALAGSVYAGRLVITQITRRWI